MLNPSIIYKTLLKVNPLGPGTYPYMGSDSEELHQQLLKTQPLDWYYRHHPVTYTLNSQGYRTAQELNQIDWVNSTVILGCSNVFGDGVEEHYTVSSQLQRLLAEPVINLGIGGAGPALIQHNLTVLRAHYPRPRRIVIFWPDRARTVTYEGVSASLHGSWNMQPHSAADLWNQGSNTDNYFWFIRNSAQQQSRDTEYIDACIGAEDAAIINTHSLGELRRLNDAMGSRDLQHPSPAASRAMAEWIYSQTHTV